MVLFRILCLFSPLLSQLLLLACVLGVLRFAWLLIESCFAGIRDSVLVQNSDGLIEMRVAAQHALLSVQYLQLLEGALLLFLEFANFLCVPI